MWPGLWKLTIRVWNFVCSIITTTMKSYHYCRIWCAFFCSLWKWDSTFWMKDISENITQCKLCSHGQFLQAQSHTSAVTNMIKARIHILLTEKQCSTLDIPFTNAMHKVHSINPCIHLFEINTCLQLTNHVEGC